MPIILQTPTTYLITNGATTERTTTPTSDEFTRVLALVERAVSAGITLIQLREKELPARTLYDLTVRAAQITAGSATRLLVNDRADVARAAGADGVHLTTRSLEARIVRRTLGHDFLIGVSTHSLAEASTARDEGADFATFGPIFETPSKRGYGAPVGLGALNEAARALAPFPLLALGGIALGDVHQVLQAGARGVAAIRLFSDAHDLTDTLRAIEGAALTS